MTSTQTLEATKPQVSSSKRCLKSISGCDNRAELQKEYDETMHKANMLWKRLHQDEDMCELTKPTSEWKKG